MERKVFKNQEQTMEVEIENRERERGEEGLCLCVASLRNFLWFGKKYFVVYFEVIWE